MESGSFTTGEIITLVFVAIGVLFMLISSIGILRQSQLIVRQ